jgi:hypothetical protein
MEGAEISPCFTAAGDAGGAVGNRDIDCGLGTMRG